MFLNRAGVQNNYSHKVRIGNWSEEQELEELRMKEFLHRKESGSLLIHHVSKHMNECLYEVPLSSHDDNSVHIGDSIMLYSLCTGGVLSVDPLENIPWNDKAFNITTSSLIKGHVARNVFKIEGYNNEPTGEILKFGQSFRLRLHETLEGSSPFPFYLHSQPTSTLCSAKVSRKQIVCMVPQVHPSYDSVWYFQWKEIGQRFEMEGQAVPSNAQVILVHAGTQQALYSSARSHVTNDFGSEYEVTASSKMDIKKSQGLYSELRGKTTTDVPFRKEQIENYWAVLMASGESSSLSAPPPAAADSVESEAVAPASDSAPAAAASSSPPAASSASSAAAFPIPPALLSARDNLLRRGAGYLCTFFRALSALTNSAFLTDAEFRKLFLQFHFNFSHAQLDDIKKSLAEAGRGVVSVRKVSELLLGEWDGERAKFIERLWRDISPSGAPITITALSKLYIVAQHPDVLYGLRNTKSVLEDVLTNLTGTSGLISENDFTRYYRIQSIYVEKDKYFVESIERQWKKV